MLEEDWYCRVVGVGVVVEVERLFDFRFFLWMEGEGVRKGKWIGGN